jgi:lysozyme
MKYTISEDGLALIKKYEGLRLAAYICPAGKLTVGYGHTGEDVHAGTCVTELEADTLLRKDAHAAENCLGSAIQTPLSQSEADACISFIFNLGCGAFRGSTLARYLNAGDFDAAAGQFKRWDKATVNGVLTPLAGLTARREAEEALFTRSA